MAGFQFDDNGMLIVNGEAPPAPATATPAAPAQTPEAAPVAEPTEEAPAEEGGGIGFAVKETGKALVGGIRDGAVEIADTAAWAGDGIRNAITGGRELIKTNGDDGWEWLTDDEAMARNDIDQEVLDAAFGKREFDEIVPQVPENESVVGGVGRGITQFVAGYGFIGKATSALKGSTKAAQTLVAMGKGALTDFVTFDAHEDRMSDFLRDNVGLTDPITEFLQAEDDDSILEGKLKNTLEGLGLGIATEGLFSLVKAFKRAKAIELKEGPEAAADAMNADLVEAEQLGLFDELSDPNLRVDQADVRVAGKKTEAKPRAEGEPLESAGEVTKHNVDKNSIAPENPRFADGSTVNGESLTKHLEYEYGLRSGGSIPDPDRLPSEDIFNMDKLMTSVDAQDLINEAAAMDTKGVIPANTTLAEMKERSLQALSDSTGVGVIEIERNIAALAKDASKVPETVLAAQTLMSDLAAKAVRLAEKIAAGGGDAATRAQLVRTNARLAEVSANVKAVKKGSAQTTVSGRVEHKNWLTDEALDDADIMSQMMKNIEDVDTDELAKLILLNRSAKGGTRGLVQISEGSKGGFKAFMEFYINSILSGPKTHVINVLSNGATMVALPAEKILGGALSRDREMVLEGFRQYQGMRFALRDSVKMMGMAFRQGRNLLDPEAALLEANGVDYRAIRSDSKNPAIRNLINGVGTVVRFPSRMLTTSDEFFKQMNYRSSVYSQVSGEAARMVDAGKLKQADMGKWIADRVEASVNKDGSARSQRNIDFAREATYTNELRKGSVSRDIQNFTNKHPAMKLILPFVRTPTNILRAGIQRTPGLHRLSQGMKADLASGDPRLVAQARGKLVTGSTMWAGAAALAFEGTLTGTGPADPVARQNLMETGWRPYSFKVGDRYVSYQRMDPFAMFFGIAADIAAMSGGVSDAKMNEIATTAVIGLVNNIGSKTYLTGIIDIVEAASQPERYLESTLQRYASSMVPMSAAMREIRKMDDPMMREVRSVVDAVQNTIPGMSDKLPAKRSWVTGKPIVYPVGWGADMMSPVGEAFASMNPILQGHDLNDTVLDEIAARPGGFTAPTRTQRGVELTSAQYSRLLELHGTVKNPSTGQTMYDALRSTIESAGYQALPSDITDRAVDPRSKLLSKLTSGYREVALKMLMKEDEELRLKIIDQSSKMAQNARSGFNPQPQSSGPVGGYDSLIQLGK